MVTPNYVVQPSGSPTSYQYGCVAIDFSLATGFASAIATLSDSATSGNMSESGGPNGCTFEPTSDTGIVIVRNLIDNTLGTQNETYAPIDSGILP